MPVLFLSERCESLWATLPYCIADARNPEDITEDALDHSADVVRYVLTAANQGQRNHRSNVKSGAHPLMWSKRDRDGMYSGGQRVEDSLIGRR